jgi:hypothetical protein
MMLAGAVNLSGPAALYWRVELRSKGSDRAQPGGAVDYEQVFRDAGPGLWRAIYAFAAGQSAVADDAVAEAFACALERGSQGSATWCPGCTALPSGLAAEDLRRVRRDAACGPQGRRISHRKCT